MNKASWGVIAATIAAAFMPQAALADGPPLKYGIGLHGPLTWGRATPDKSGYNEPVFEGERYKVPVELLEQVKKKGFDFVRLTVDPGPLMASRGHAREALDRKIISVVKQIRAIGLDVLVDFHPIGMVKSYAPAQIESPELFPAYVETIRSSTRLLAKLGSEHIAIEPMNEPQLGYDPSSIKRWQGMMEDLYRAVRSEAPEMTVVLTGGQGGSMQGLFNLDPAPFDENVRYSFHYYLPFVFTHQGVDNPMPNGRIWLYAVGLPYPASPEGFSDFWEKVQRRIKNASNLNAEQKRQLLDNGQRQLEEYFSGKGTRDAIHADFRKIQDWAEEHDVDTGKILLGEFGSTQKGPANAGAAPDDRMRWIGDVRKEAEKRGFGWSFWALSGPSASGMTLVSVTNQQQLDARTVSALGKN